MAENLTRGVVLAQRVRRADTFGRRLRGLLFAPPLRPGEALWIVPCRSIHTFAMRYTIDAVFLDADGRVVHVCSHLAPWRATRVVPRARTVLELPAGVVEQSGTRPGDRIRIHDGSG
ncbi:MAG TPA: DUF192 domain-containing protein [Fredinandcohnia sp.]|nr:DUF192 domain-containing protein [Fredinandcohnia sp.]